MSKQISGSEYPISKIFSADFEYNIPSYQRPYSWTVDQASELFDDLYDFYKTEIEDGYFLGSIVLIKQEGSPKSDVVDGQQRLTTLTIMLAVIADCSDGDDKRTLSRYIYEEGNDYEGLDPKPRLTLRNRDKEFFENYVQMMNFSDLFDLEYSSIYSESQRNIHDNAKLLYKRVKDNLGDQSELKEFASFILKKCYLVAVSTPNQQSAFRVFSVMNSRGLDLQTTDIVKADIIGKIADNRQSEFNQKWEDMEASLGRSGFNDLFTYVRMIFAKEKAKRSLLEEFRSHVLDVVHNPEVFIDDILQPYAESMYVVKNQDSEHDDVKYNLSWLNRIDNSDWIPAAILFISKHKNDMAAITEFVKKLETLASYMHVTSKNVNQRIERYGKLLGEIESEIALSSLELTDCEKTTFLEVLDSEVYRLTARRRNYLILRLDSFLADGAATYDSKILTIEHVLPQTVREGSLWHDNWSDEEMYVWVHKIANLVPLNKRRNSAASNYDFERKKKEYFMGRKNVSSYALTSQVLAEGEWSPAVVEKRQKMLLGVLSKNWNLIV